MKDRLAMAGIVMQRVLSLKSLLVDKVADASLEALDELEENEFVEQAEYIDRHKFIAVNAEHPHGEAIKRKLVSAGAKLLVGPRGCGKTTLMLDAYYSTLHENRISILPVYVNFKFSLKLEPLMWGRQTHRTGFVSGSI